MPEQYYADVEFTSELLRQELVRIGKWHDRGRTAGDPAGFMTTEEYLARKAELEQIQQGLE